MPTARPETSLTDAPGGRGTIHLFVLILPTALLVAILACAADHGGETVIEFWGMGREGEVVAALVPEFERRNPGLRVQGAWP